MPGENDYPWAEHPEAVLGTVHLYFAYRRDPASIPDEVIRSFVDLHQDGGRLSVAAVRTAVAGMGKLYGRPGGGVVPGSVFTSLSDSA